MGFLWIELDEKEEVKRMRKNEGFYSWFAGFAAGEGYLQALVRRGNRHWVDVTFQIALRADDTEILEYIQDRLCVGYVKTYACKGNRNPQSRYTIGKVSELYDVIVPIFDNYPLRNRKEIEYHIWRRIVERCYFAKKNKRAPYPEEYWLEMNEDIKLLAETRQYHGVTHVEKY